MIPDRHLSQYVPYILRDIEEFKAIMAAGQAAFDAVDDGTHVGVWRALERAIKDAFLITDYIRDENGEIVLDVNGDPLGTEVVTTEYGLSRWENMLGIVPAPQGEDTRQAWLKKRLDIILARIRGDAPYTYKALVEKLLYAIVKDKTGYKVELSVYGVSGWTSDPYSIKVTVDIGDDAIFAAVDAMLKRVIPVNLQFATYRMYNRHKDYRPYTHEQMSNWTHGDLKAREWQEGDWDDNED